MPPHQEGNHTDWSKPGRFATSSLDPDAEMFGYREEWVVSLPSSPVCPISDWPGAQPSRSSQGSALSFTGASRPLDGSLF